MTHFYLCPPKNYSAKQKHTRLELRPLLVLFDFDIIVYRSCLHVKKIKKYTKHELINGLHLGRIVKPHKYG